MQYTKFGLFLNLPILYKLKSLFGVTVALFNSANLFFFFFKSVHKC